MPINKLFQLRKCSLFPTQSPLLKLCQFLIEWKCRSISEFEVPSLHSEWDFLFVHSSIGHYATVFCLIEKRSVSASGESGDTT